MTPPKPDFVVRLPSDVLEVLADRVVALLGERLERGQAEPWIGVAEAAEHLHCKPQRIYALVHQGRLCPHRDGARLLFRRSELDAWLAGGSGRRPVLNRANGIRDGR